MEINSQNEENKQIKIEPSSDEKIDKTKEILLKPQEQLLDPLLLLKKYSSKIEGTSNLSNPIRCVICKEFAKLENPIFADKQAIKAHVELVHDGRIQCGLCDFWFTPIIGQDWSVESYIPKLFFCDMCAAIKHGKDSLPSEENYSISAEEPPISVEEPSISTTNQEKQICCNDYKRPPLSYNNLITLALKSKRGYLSSVGDIYEFISDFFPFFNSPEKRNDWKNCIRHQLSTVKAFSSAKAFSKNLGRALWTFTSEKHFRNCHESLLRQCKNSHLDINKATPKFDILVKIVDDEIVHQNSEISQTLQRNELPKRSKPSANIPANPTTWTLQILPENSPKNDNNNNTISRNDSNGVILTNKPITYSMFEKPPLTYGSMVTLALKSQKNQQSTVKQMYQCILEFFPYFNCSKPEEWQNQIRHELTKNKFSKTEVDEEGTREAGKKSHFWTFTDKKHAEKCQIDLMKNYKNVEDKIKASTPKPEVLEEIIYKGVTAEQYDSDEITVIEDVKKVTNNYQNFHFSKPHLSNVHLITFALKSKKNHLCTINEIYKYLVDFFPFFKTKPSEEIKDQIVNYMTKSSIFVRTEIQEPCMMNSTSYYFWTFYSQEIGMSKF